MTGLDPADSDDSSSDDPATGERSRAEDDPAAREEASRVAGGDRSTERRVRVGEPVVRADPAVTGDRAQEAVDFDPEDPESLERAAETIREFTSDGRLAGVDNVAMLRTAAACAALVRGLGSYRAAADRVGDVPVSVVRKWARVHDLPQSVRRHVARGNIAPSAAKHVARVRGTDRLDLAWAVVDHDLTVREVRRLATEVDDGTSTVVALRQHGVELGHVSLSLPVESYRELRREASMRNCDVGDVVAEALTDRYEG